MGTVHTVGNSHRLAMVAALGAMLASTGESVATNSRRIQERRKIERIRQHWPVKHGVGYVPHQGPRECARRRGGDDWLNHKAADRIRRGLPVSWPYEPLNPDS